MATPYNNKKLYLKVKIDAKWIPYWVGQRYTKNIATIPDIMNILGDYIKDERDLLEATDRFKEYIIPVDFQIRFAGRPSFFSQFATSELVEEFTKVCTKISKSTADMHVMWVLKKIPVAFFTMYEYWNK